MGYLLVAWRGLQDISQPTNSKLTGSVSASLTLCASGWNGKATMAPKFLTKVMTLILVRRKQERLGITLQLHRGNPLPREIYLGLKYFIKWDSLSNTWATEQTR